MIILLLLKPIIRSWKTPVRNIYKDMETCEKQINKNQY